MVFFLKKNKIPKLYTSNMSEFIIEKSRSDLIQALRNLRDLRQLSQASCENAFREEMDEAVDNASFLVNAVMDSILASVEDSKKSYSMTDGLDAPQNESEKTKKNKKKPEKPKKPKNIKKPRTARSFFAAELRASLKEEGVEIKTITANIAIKWKELENKDMYTKMCEDDKKRYDDELEASGQLPAKKPFRGVTLYNCFSKMRRPDVIKQGFKGKDATKKISSMWKEFKAIEDVEDTDEWKELEDLKKKTDDAKKKKATEDEDVMCSSFVNKKKKKKQKKATGDVEEEEVLCGKAKEAVVEKEAKEAKNAKDVEEAKEKEDAEEAKAEKAKAKKAEKAEKAKAEKAEKAKAKKAEKAKAAAYKAKMKVYEAHKKSQNKKKARCKAKYDKPMTDYKILGLKKGADMSSIKSAYHKLARVWHPDKNGDEEVFKKINTAYDNLKNPKHYDDDDDYDPETYNSDDEHYYEGW